MFTRQHGFIALLFIITAMTTADLVSDYFENTETWHLVLEAMIVLFSVFGISSLLRETSLRQKEIEAIREQLQKTEKNLSQSREHLKVAGEGFIKAVHKQFDAWSLTPSEKEISILLLKGLSFEEIAGLRQTKEKTVRQQATSIYRKSGLSGRHEFSAWFFEDLMM